MITRRRMRISGMDHIIITDGVGRMRVRYAIPDYHRLCLPEDHPDKAWPQTSSGHRGSPAEGLFYKS